MAHPTKLSPSALRLFLRLGAIVIDDPSISADLLDAAIHFVAMASVGVVLGMDDDHPMPPNAETAAKAQTLALERLKAIWDDAVSAPISSAQETHEKFHGAAH